MHSPEQYRGQKVVVLGMAKSGQAVATLFGRLGAHVVINDRKPREECPEAEALESQGMTVICGGHPENLMDEQTVLVVKNPGIPYSSPPVKQALDHGIEVVTEVEVAAHLLHTPIIGITGSNGKTTTTSWVGEILQRSGQAATVAGNIGTPLSELVDVADNANWIVAELSSFQLKGTSAFRPKIACLLNVYETHLDYHGGMEDYTLSKGKLFANQQVDDVAVVNADDEICCSLAASTQARLLPFSMKRTLDTGVYLQQDATGKEWIMYALPGEQAQTLLAVDQISILGRHNVQNGLAVTAICLAAGVEAASIAEGLRTFKGVEHRLEYVVEDRGCRYYNDSKATNPAATLATLSAFEDQVVLIAGGLDRGSSYEELLPVFTRPVTGIVLLGQTRDKLRALAERSGLTRVQVIDHSDPQQAMEEAVRAAREMAQPGDTILLSTACASWDMYESYEQRGRMFKQSVHNLV